MNKKFKKLSALIKFGCILSPRDGNYGVFFLRMVFVITQNLQLISYVGMISINICMLVVTVSRNQSTKH